MQNSAVIFCGSIHAEYKKIFAKVTGRFINGEDNGQRDSYPWIEWVVQQYIYYVLIKLILIPRTVCVRQLIQ